MARLNSLPVHGFGRLWRRVGDRAGLHAGHATFKAFVLDHLEADLLTIARHGPNGVEVHAIQQLVDTPRAWLAATDARLAHGDFDITPIFQQRGRFTGLIDFGEIRGAVPLYDLGHFRCHEQEVLPVRGLPWLLEGYAEIATLPPDSEQRIALISLLVGTRRLARSLRLHPNRTGYQAVRVAAIRRDLAFLGL